MTYTSEEIARRRGLEDQLLYLGRELERVDHEDRFIREAIRKLIGDARESGIKVKEVSKMTGLSTQTLHTWMQDLMRPIPDIHFGLAGPTPRSLEQAVLRTIGERPNDYEWAAAEVCGLIPKDWPGGTIDEVQEALENLVKWHMIWDGEKGGYRVGPPNDLRVS